MTEQKNTGRRRGDQLEHDIYAATYSLLRQEGVAAITFSQVATIANTSRSVLYRYWDSPFDLLFQTVMFEISQQTAGPIETPLDEGSLHADLLTLAHRFLGQTTTDPFRFFRLLFTNSLQQQNQDQLQALNAKLDQTHLQMMRPVIENALRRHELMQTPAVAIQLVLFDLLRYHDLMNSDVETEEKINALISDIVMPSLLFMNN
ncbi:TetR/AcrR family transcriptional regulator [Furfurilactobacillus siliginis]|uniref:TetR family transcriptional regulator n=1 Tax=Furfurilactobacillus siliginis TaxID=348151 RepID=A0A0R2L5I4_9LACO|nr:TetR family transcriptional regulator [Furfurilactobacillus siliginis]KRN95110.1 transcription regulator [Furfurilactobacillus siliginis]GEK28367.1 TetR family transcriptional regulator [Furfurilactobacillus siliginis]